MDRLRLDDFPLQSPHLSQAQARTWAEAASVCLNRRNHPKITTLHFPGPIRKDPCELERMEITDPMENTYADPSDATADGAYAMALMAAKYLEGYGFINKVRGKGPGFDHYLSRNNSIDNLAEARLEVSGILDEEKTSMSERLRIKRKQIRKPAPLVTTVRFLVGVVGFSKPQVWLEDVKPWT